MFSIQPVMIKRLFVFVLAGVFLEAGYGSCQSTTSAMQSIAAPLPSFEVATVRPSTAEDDGDSTSVNQNANRIRLDFSNTPLIFCIQQAYHVKDYQISGPKWIRSKRYDIIATAPVVPNDKQAWRLMLQSLLADRFRLTIHRETKEMPIYALVVGKRSASLANLHPVDEKGGSGTHGTNNHYKFTGNSMPTFAEFLSDQTDRPVEDMTGLSGKFDFTLQFSRDSASGNAASANDDPSIYTALQEQLGLKLDPRKAQIELLVVDHAEQTPTAN